MGGVLISGGSGSLGMEIARQIHEIEPNKRIVIYNRDEGKQARMASVMPEGGAGGLRYMVGDILDSRRLKMALKEIEEVYHCAAMKMIDKCEYNPWEAVNVNVNGTLSVARACIESKVRRAVFVSTDKSPDPVSTYGRTKGVAEDAWIHGNIYGFTEFVATRYGNVIGANKSVFHKWATLAEQGETIPVTHNECTRFFWTVHEAATFCRQAMGRYGERGAIYIPKMKSYRIRDIAKQYGPTKEVGFRCPEKVHETLWTDWETEQVRDRGNHYILYPYTHPWTEALPMQGSIVYHPHTSEDYSDDLPEDLRYRPTTESTNRG